MPDELGEDAGFGLKMLGAAESSGVEQNEQHAVADGFGRVHLAARSAGEAAGQHVEQQAQAEPLVRLRSAEREDSADRLFVQYRGIGGRFAVGVLQPAFGNAFAFLVGDAHFALGTDAGADVKDERFGGRRNADADRVGADAAFDAAGRHDTAALAVRVDGADEHHAEGGGAFGIFAKPADVPAAAQGAGRHAKRFRFFHEPVEQSMSLHLADAPMGVGRKDRRRFVEDFKLRAGEHLPVAQSVEVLRNAHDAVRIVAAEISFDQAVADDVGFVGRHAAGREELPGVVQQHIGGDGGHNRFLSRWTIMTFRVTASRRRVNDADHDVFTLADGPGSVRAEVWPSFGGNCLRWSVTGPNGPLELLYAAPDWEQNPVPTRSGIPVLFPFPNRIRDGRFEWNGRTYQLPINCPQNRHAIHGFACRHRWRVLETRADDDRASIVLAFHSMDHSAVANLWPSEYRLELTVVLRASALELVAAVQNCGAEPLPWGLGYHPYFHLPVAAASSRRASPVLEETKLRLPAEELWELQEYLPTGRKLPLDHAHYLRSGRYVGDMHVDDLYTNLADRADHEEDFGSIDYGSFGRIDLAASKQFRHAVVFIPPHRQAVCIEPYTCVTNAINLHGVETGLQILAPGASSETWFAMRYERTR